MSETGAPKASSEAQDAGPRARMSDQASRPSDKVVAGFAAIGYRISGMLGMGGFGAVWEATREDDGAIVAIKTVHSDLLASCQRLHLEAAALRAIGPPFVPAFYDEGKLSDGTSYLVFERLTMPSLATRLGEQPLEMDAFFALAGAIVEALGAAHARGFLHRDIKPDNIFVSERPHARSPAGAPARPRAVLIDFGLAKSLPGVDMSAKEHTIADTSTGIVLGTPLYMSPEQCVGRLAIDERADIYGLGVVFFEMLAGRTPFEGDSPQVRIAHISRRPPRLSRFAPVPAPLERVVLRCLAKLPERRYGSAASLAEALDQARKRIDAQPAHALDVATHTSGPAPAPARRAPVLSGEQILAGLLYFAAETDTAAVQHALEIRGGRLVSVSGKHCIAAFGLDTADNPLDRALDSAQALYEQGVALRVTVDRARVRIYRGRDGSRRILATALQRRDLAPRATDPTGVYLTFASAGSVAEGDTAALADREGLYRFLGRRLAHEHKRDFVGRDELVHELLDSARHANAHSQPTIATVLAEAGYGKSHLAAAVIAELGHTGIPIRVIRIRARTPLEGDNDHVLRQLLRAALELDDMDLTGAELGDHGRGILCERLGTSLGNEVWPAVALVLGWLSGSARAVRRLSAAPAALRAAAARAAGEALRHLAKDTLVCCVLDDAHFADETALDAIEYATLAEARARLWVIALADPSFARARPHWAGRAARSHPIRMEQLSGDSAAALCRRLLEPARNIPARIVDRLVAETQGNPLLLTELARAIKRHGLIRRHGRGDAWFLAVDELDRLPELPRVEWLADKELGALPEELAAHARLMALLAADFTAAEVDGVLAELERDGLGEMFALDAWVCVERLVERGLLVRQEGEQVGFRHDVIREQVARSIPEALGKRLHKAAFHYYSDTRDMAEHRRLPLLAYHAAKSGAPEAATMYLDLADRAGQRHDYFDAQMMYSRALELMTPDDRLLRMRGYKGRGIMHCRLSRFADALEDLRSARDMAAVLGQESTQIELLLDEAMVLDWSRDFVAAHAVVEQAAALADTCATPFISARLTLAQGRARFRDNDFDAARELLERAYARAETLGDAGYEIMVIALMLLGWTLISTADWDRADAVFTQSVSLCEERGDTLHLAAVLNNRRELRMAQNDVVRAAADGLRAQRIGRELGQIGIEFATSYNLAELYYLTHDFDAAAVHIERAVAIEPSCSRQPIARLLDVRLLVVAGNLDRAGQRIAELDIMQTQARAQGDDDALLSDAELLLLAAAALSVHPGDAAAVEARARVAADTATRIEALELVALHHERAGRPDEAERLFRDALATGAGNATLIEDRVRSHLSRLSGSS